MKKDIRETLKNKIWDQYLDVKGGDFEMWLEGLSPIEEFMWKERFDERNQYRIK